jgi:hypothetical protein
MSGASSAPNQSSGEEARLGFIEEQNELYARVQREEVRVVEVDPDGTMLEDWLAVVIRHPTGVVYSHQCAGVACEHRLAEGYLVMLGRAPYGIDEPPIHSDELIQVFHNGDACMYHWAGNDLPDERIAWLEKLVRRIPYWAHEAGNPLGVRAALELDFERREDIAEAWIPVITPDGPGVLIYENCD